jgi:predicted small secreted protein
MKSSNPLKSIRLTDGTFADRLSMKYGWVVGQATNRSGMVHVESAGNRKAAFRDRPIQISISRTYPVMPLHVKLIFIHTQMNRIIHLNSDFQRINGAIATSMIRQDKQITVLLKEGSKQANQLLPGRKVQAEKALQLGIPVKIPAVSLVDLRSAKQEIVIPINRIRVPLHLQAIVNTLQTVKQQFDKLQRLPLASLSPTLISSQSPAQLPQRQKVQKTLTVPESIRRHADFIESARTLEKIQHSSHPSMLEENQNAKRRNVASQQVLEIQEGSEKRQVANVVRRQRNETNQVSHVVNRTNSVVDEVRLTNQNRTTSQMQVLNDTREKRQVANVVRRQRNETNQVSHVVNRTNNVTNEARLTNQVRITNRSIKTNQTETTNIKNDQYQTNELLQPNQTGQIANVVRRKRLEASAISDVMNRMNNVTYSVTNRARVINQHRITNSSRMSNQIETKIQKNDQNQPIELNRMNEKRQVANVVRRQLSETSQMSQVVNQSNSVTNEVRLTNQVRITNRTVKSNQTETKNQKNDQNQPIELDRTNETRQVANVVRRIRNETNQISNVLNRMNNVTYSVTNKARVLIQHLITKKMLKMNHTETSNQENNQNQPVEPSRTNETKQVGNVVRRLRNETNQISNILNRMNNITNEARLMNSIRITNRTVKTNHTYPINIKNGPNESIELNRTNETKQVANVVRRLRNETNQVSQVVNRMNNVTYTVTSKARVMNQHRITNQIHQTNVIGPTNQAKTSIQKNDQNPSNELNQTNETKQVANRVRRLRNETNQVSLVVNRMNNVTYTVTNKARMMNQHRITNHIRQSKIIGSTNQTETTNQKNNQIPSNELNRMNETKQVANVVRRLRNETNQISNVLNQTNNIMNEAHLTNHVRITNRMVKTNQTETTNHKNDQNQSYELIRTNETRQVANVVRRLRNETNQISNVLNRMNNVTYTVTNKARVINQHRITNQSFKMNQIETTNHEHNQNQSNELNRTDEIRQEANVVRRQINETNQVSHIVSRTNRLTNRMIPTLITNQINERISKNITTSTNHTQVLSKINKNRKSLVNLQRFQLVERGEASPTAQREMDRLKVRSTLLTKEMQPMKAVPLEVVLKPSPKEAPEKEIIKSLESAIKTVESDLNQAKVQWSKPSLDMKRLTDQMYREFSSRIRLEQQRRGH